MLHCYKKHSTDQEQNVIIYYLSKFGLSVIRRYVKTNTNSQHLTIDHPWVPYLAPTVQGYCTVIKLWPPAPKWDPNFFLTDQKSYSHCTNHRGARDCPNFDHSYTERV